MFDSETYSTLSKRPRLASDEDNPVNEICDNTTKVVSDNNKVHGKKEEMLEINRLQDELEAEKSSREAILEVMGENIIKGKEEELLERLEKYCQVQYINYM